MKLYKMVNIPVDEKFSGSKKGREKSAIKDFGRGKVSEEDRISELNKKILDNAPISIIAIDKNGYITSANKYYFNLSKTTDYRGHNIFKSQFFIRENLIGDYKKLLADGTIVKREECYEKNNKGEDKYLKIVAVPLKDKDGNIEGALSMAADDTEAVSFRNKLAELNRDLEKKVAERTDELNMANKELVKVLSEKEMFVSDVSHELRTSLAIVHGNTELIAQGLAQGADRKESCDQVFCEIKRMSVMLADLTLLASSDSAVQKLNYGKIDLDRLISSVLKSLRVMARKKNVEIEHGKSKGKIEITADKGKLEKLLMNLVRNGIRYNKENGWVKIWAETAENEVIINVADSGIGIAKEHLSKIFDRFYCVDKEKSRSDGGSGLGLAICKLIAEVHGGRVEVQSKVGKGSLFTVRLPRDRRDHD